MPGPTPKPTALKLLDGTRPDRVNAEAPEPEAGRPEPPDRFGEETKAEWHRICDELEALGVLSKAHGFALAIYCGAWARLRLAEDAIEENGLFITSRGAIKANPAGVLAGKCEAIMVRILTEFGLTAASASKVKGRTKAPEDKLTKLLNRRRTNGSPG